MKHESRIIPLDLNNLSATEERILDAIPGDGLKGDLAPVNVLGTLMHSNRLLGDFLNYWVTSKNVMSLSVREQELIILRMGFHYASNYVWKHHIPVAREFGVSDEAIQTLQNDSLPAGVFSERELALLALCDEMVTTRNVGDAGWAAGKQQLSDVDIIDLIHLISQYVLFALTNNVFRVVVEKPLQDLPELTRGKVAG